MAEDAAAPAGVASGWAWLKLAPVLLMLLLSTAAGAVGGAVAAMMGNVGEARVCGGVAMMAWKGHVRGDGPPVAVIDGGCTHVCFNDVHAFKPGTLRPPAKPTYMRLGDDSQVTFEGIHHRKKRQTKWHIVWIELRLCQTI